MYTVHFRAAARGEEPAMSALSRRVFDAHIGALDTPECQAAFHRFASAEAMLARADGNRRWVAVAGDAIVGMLEVRGGTHIAMLFVESAYQRHGVGRGLVEAAFGPAAAWPALTVNSAPTAVGAYERWGFAPVAPVQTSPEGIVYLPMRREATIPAAG